MMMHGGDIYRNKVNIDFSVNVNPLGIPKKVLEAMEKCLHFSYQYPDINCEELTKEIAKRFQVEKDCIVCGNGASELFMAIEHGIRPLNTGIVVPSFYGYEYVSKAGWGRNSYLVLNEDQGFSLTPDLIDGLEKVGLLFLANPNNPTGNLTSKEVMLCILQKCLAKNIVVVVDECFLEFTEKEEEYSLKHEIHTYPNLIVVRAFTKIYSIPGVRLGYLFCGNENLRHRIKSQLPEWNVSLIAQEAGIAACKETEYVKQTVAYIAEERALLAKGLEEEGIKVYPSCANYLLLYSKEPLYQTLLKKRILIRDCSDFHGLQKGFYRVAVKTREENQSLLDAIRAIRNERN